MRILIIGANGFIGSHAVQYFQQKGNEVFGCDISAFSASGIKYHQVDRENPDFNFVFENNHYDVCINASGSADISYSILFPEKDYLLNVRNVELMLNAIVEYNSSCKFINFSSAAVYGNPSALPVKETAPIQPLSTYGQHKFESELLLKKYASDSNIKSISLRVFSAYGPGLKKQLFWDTYQKLMKSQSENKNTIELFGTGKESRDFIFVNDLMEAINTIIQRGSFVGETINVASGIETTVENAAKLFIEMFDEKLKIIFNGNEKPGDPLNWRADISILKSYGFSSTTGIKTGLEKYYEWLKNNPQL
jgi:dTDP-glucose 4,6-dehydratase/UDP-glucose 4-epimerase